MLTLRVIPMLMVIIYLLLLFYWVFLEVNHLITFVISCTEFKLRIGNFSTNAQLLLPAPRSPAILTSNLDSGSSRLCVIIFAYEIVKCLLGKTFRTILLNKLSV